MIATGARAAGSWRHLDHPVRQFGVSAALMLE